MITVFDVPHDRPQKAHELARDRYGSDLGEFLIRQMVKPGCSKQRQSTISVASTIAD